MKNKTLLCLFGLIYFLAACDSKGDVLRQGMNAEGNGALSGARGVTFSNEDILPGYILSSIPNSASTYLLDRSGKVVHEWKGAYPVNTAYLQNDGSLIQLAHDPDFPVFAGGGEAGRIQKLSWEGKTLWDFEYADERTHVHHDIAVLPNGNILAIAWESVSSEDAVKLGRKPDMIAKAGVWPDKIIEIKPGGNTGGEIVWQWRMWDHVIQDHDPKAKNYGDPAKHPELLDINVGHPVSPAMPQFVFDSLRAIGQMAPWRNQTPENLGSDAYHINAVNYNPELDQIAFSSPELNEIFIIDHSTSTAEAASHKGGRWGRGGDLLYRWGNPQNYRQGDSTDQQLFYQHDIRWIEPGYPGSGNLTLFNNNIPGEADSLNHSAIFEIKPPVDASGKYGLAANHRFGPESPVWTYIADDPVSFYSFIVSGAHRLSNGNTFITEGVKGRVFEVTPDGEIVWDYMNPFRGEIRKLNGDPIDADFTVLMQFRATFIPEKHPALAGRELLPLDPQPLTYSPPLTAAN